MDHATGGEGGGERRSRADGGDDAVAGGANPPPAPTEPGEIVAQLDTGDLRGETVYVLRLALGSATDKHADQLIEELRTEVDVLATTHGLTVGPEQPGIFDVVVSMDYDPATVVEALVEPAPVAGATAVRVSRAAIREGGADDDAVSEALAAVDSDDATHEESADPGPDATDPAPAGDASAADDAPDGSATLEAGGDPDAAEPDDDGTIGRDDVPGNHPAFEQFKLETDRVGYDRLVEELEETELPGEFEEEADIEPLLASEEPADETAMGAGTPGDGAPAPGGPERATRPPAGADGDVDVPPVANSDGGTDVAMGPTADLTPRAVADALVTALQEDALTEEQRRTIAEEFDGGPPKTLLVKLDHLQREIDELAAYKDSLEAFIEEYGSGEGLVDEVRAAMQQFWTDVQAVQSDVDELSDAIEATDERVDDVAREVGSVDERLERVDDIAVQLDNQEARLSELEALEERVDGLVALDDRVRALDNEVGALREAVEAGGGADEELAQRVDGVERQLAELSDSVSSVATDTGESVDSLADRLDSLEERVERQEQWRERVLSVLAGDEDW